jgi:DNA (cytosine-5)-methyltransferase 1
MAATGDRSGACRDALERGVRVLDLFSGIGAFSLGLEQTGMKTVAFCEIDPYCRAVLKKRWPGVPLFENICELKGEMVGAADVICGGFPCQDISIAGRRAGLGGENSGLWGEFFRLVCELRPKFVVVENTPGLCVRGLGDILGDLANAGYDAEWEGIPAAAFGAPHLRARQWVLAYPSSFGDRLQKKSVLAGWHGSIDSSRWEGEPGIRRVDDGTPDRVDRLKAIGNSLVPAIAESIGWCIQKA